MASIQDEAPANKWAAIALLAFCEVLAMALWFSASAVLPALRLEYNLTDFQASLISSSVSAVLGMGAVGSLFGGLFADRLGRTTLIPCFAHGVRFGSLLFSGKFLAEIAHDASTPGNRGVPRFRVR